MKRTKHTVLTIFSVLMFTLLFVGAGHVFADTGKIASADWLKSEISAKTIVKSTTSAPAYTEFTVGAGATIVVPVKSSDSGRLYLDSKVGESTGADYVYFYLCSDYDINEEGLLEWSDYADFHYLEPGETQKGYEALSVRADATCYVIIQNMGETDVRARLRARVYTTGERTDLLQGSSYWRIASGYSQSGKYNTTYFKVKPSKTGVMTVSLKEYGISHSSGYVTLYSSSKKALSNKVRYYPYYGDYVKFGVKKNTTYYIKVSNCAGSYEENYKFGIKYKVDSATDRAIGKKSSAKRLYRGNDSTASLFVAKNENSVDWYKFTVKKARKTKVGVYASGVKSGSLYVTLYNKNLKKLDTVTIDADESAGYLQTRTKLGKGTYYVKVKKSLKASGKYSIKWIQ